LTSHPQQHSSRKKIWKNHLELIDEDGGNASPSPSLASTTGRKCYTTSSPSLICQATRETWVIANYTAQLIPAASSICES
jgi:hypothetical protein